jgi:asparagine synthase (glutamine-hydrolysing)
MCGIAGRVTTRLDTNRAEKLLRQLDAINHRGPDGFGEYLDSSCTMGMRRLAIVDLEKGEQPGYSQSGKVAVIFNGEIYNYRNLATRFELGKTSNVTEANVIAELYEKFGVKSFGLLEGFFAIGVWDITAKRITLVRDRIGKKPLFYGVCNSELFFASEIKAILAAGFPMQVNPFAVSEVLSYGYTRSSESAFRDIFQVPPGSFVTYKEGQVEIFSYWSVSSHPEKEYVSIDEAKKELKVKLISAIEKRLLSERPLGIFLSGGVDSSLISALIKEMGVQDIETFSVGFREVKYDESSFARNIAEHLGIRHNEIIVKPDPYFFLETYPKFIDFPYADSSFMPTFLLSEFASRKIKVALSGDGGDEGFAGYDRYRYNLDLERLSKFIPSSRLPNLQLKNRLFNKLNRAMRLKDFGNRYDSMMRLYDDLHLSRVLHANFLSEICDNSEQDERTSKASNDLQGLQISDLTQYLPGDLLVKMDMASMANGLEVRSPFLDPEILQFGLSLPSNFKINGRVGKFLLRELLADLIPRKLFERPKQGFAIPRAEWLRGPLRGVSREILLSKRCREREWFDSDYVSKILNKHEKGWDLDELIWPLLMVELWAINWIDPQ